MWEFVYETKNDGGTRARFQKPPAGSGAPGAMNASWGICAAMSAVWLKTVAGGDLVSRPNRNRALILSGKWENKIYAGNVDIKQFNLGLLEDAGLRPGRPRSLTAWATALEVKTAPGCYYISLGNHGIAVMTAPGAYIILTPTTGCGRRVLRAIWMNWRSMANTTSSIPITIPPGC